MAKAKTLILFIFLFLFTFAWSADAASIFVSPASGTYEVGDKVTVRVSIESGIPINAVSAILSVPTSIFTIESVSKSGSILNFWVTEPNFSQGAGILSFEGVKLGGYPGGTGAVLTATLRAVRPGTGSITFNSGQVLANDGQGTDVTSGMRGSTYSVIPKKEKPPESAPPKPNEEVIEEQPELAEPPAVPTLVPPEIHLGKKFGELAIYGETDHANAKVLLTFISETGVKVFIEGTTDDLGEFIMLVPRSLKHDTYRVSAVVIEEREQIFYSHPSNEIKIKVGSIFSDIGGEVKAGIAILAVLLGYFIYRYSKRMAKNKKIKALLRRDAKQIEDVLEKSKKDISKRSSAALTKDIKEAENLIDREVRDIENL